MIQLGKFVGGWLVWWGGGVADTNYLHPARWGWIKKELSDLNPIRAGMGQNPPHPGHFCLYFIILIIDLPQRHI